MNSAGHDRNELRVEAVRLREAELSRDRQAVVWLLLPLTCITLLGIWPNLLSALIAAVCGIAAIGPVAAVTARAYTDALIRTMCSQPSSLTDSRHFGMRTILRGFKSLDAYRLLLAAPPLALGAGWMVACVRFAPLSDLLRTRALDGAWSFPLTLALPMLIGGILSHWLEWRSWVRWGRRALLQRCGLDATALMHAEGYRWRWWWGWRPVSDLRLDALANSLSNVALALAVSGIVGYVISHYLRPYDAELSSRVSGGVVLLAGASGWGGVVLAWLSHSRSAGVKSVMAIALMLASFLFPVY